ncbi:nitroreductase [Burkholderia sp. SFA1]|uniref:nitroreductase n=1 Tax=Caballeronia sp. CLC5 TaxID=2906764 RepID=UPI001F223903|nr:nitroreductase [Caballeronia sp. CLC5]MCE4573970.1 nitroreductase [Caballeronia sp. CLC5]BBQ00815.1 nitroreductase [Burkholderia sp. SFA1]
MIIDETKPTQKLSETEHIMMSRFANRFFLDREVDLDVITGILDAARYAGTGANVQPWRVYVTAGTAKLTLTDAISRAHAISAAEHSSEYSYLPDPLPEPFASRRREFGSIFFGSLGIAHDDIDARAANTARNCRFFDAPVGLIFTIDRRLEKGSWLDLGMFIQNIMLAAKARGLDTCTQEFLSRYHAVIRSELPLAPEELVVCSMALGFGDPHWAKRRPQMPKASIEEFASFHGFWSFKE